MTRFYNFSVTSVLILVWVLSILTIWFSSAMIVLSVVWDVCLVLSLFELTGCFSILGESFPSILRMGIYWEDFAVFEVLVKTVSVLPAFELFSSLSGERVGCFYGTVEYLLRVVLMSLLCELTQSLYFYLRSISSWLSILDMFFSIPVL